MYVCVYVICVGAGAVELEGREQEIEKRLPEGAESAPQVPQRSGRSERYAFFNFLIFRFLI